LKKTHFYVASALFFSSGAAKAQDVVISEFMALNITTITDDDGDYSDWLELYNAGGSAVNLNGWYLTDERANLTKWRCPSITLPADGFLLVFASGKDRLNPAARLHTNFKLTSLGEYLALVKPDGTTKAWEYDNYPPQIEDYSYGLLQDASFARLVASRAPAKAIVPQNSTLGLTWTQAGFNDGTWTSGTTGVGYDRNPDYGSLIGLDLRASMDNVNSSAYIRVPFTVSDGSAFNGLTLRMKYDDGFIAYVNGVKVASSNAPDPPAWNSRATALNDDSRAVIFETFAIPSASGLLQAGSNVLAIQGLNENLGSSDFLILPELDGVDSGNLDRSVRQYFHQPSPGFGNLPGFPNVSKKPEFSLSSQVFLGSLSLSLTVASPQSVIRYTLDGSEPTETSPAFSAPISIQSSTRVRARGFEPGLAPSPIVSESFLSLAADVQNFSSNIPVIVIENFGGGSVPSDPFQPAFMAIFDTTNGRSALKNLPDIATRIGIKIRGSSTLGDPKHSYSLEAWDERNNDKDISPLGLPEESDWILYAPYSFDRALIRNALIYELSNRVGRYAVRTRFVELYINTGGGALAQADYAGVYVFMEKIKRGPKRVDVESLSASDDTEPLITGGYMLKIDRLDPGDSGLSAGGQGMGYVYPKEEFVTPAQGTWIKGYIDTFVTALNGASFTNPVTGYAKYIDPDSWVDHHILNVLAKNVDALRLSTYFFKKREGKLEFGPIWDFDRSMDSTDGRDDDPRTWKGTGDATDYFNYPWWGRLFQDLDFWQRWKDRWQLFRRNELSTQNINAVIDSMAAELNEAQVRNFQKWNLLGAGGYAGEISHLKQWLATRASWIDSQFLAPPVLSSQGRPITPGFQLTISAPTGTIYYTTDGSDPRSPGGAISPLASTYSGAITLNKNSRVVARANQTSDWSGPAAATFVVSTPRLVISEIMYHPADPPPGSPYDADDFEFLELMNADTQPLRLAGAHLTGGIEFTFSRQDTSPLSPGELVLVVKNLNAFSTRYDTRGMRIAGEYLDNLSNGIELLELDGPLAEPILFFSYDDTWYPSTDGNGDSLVFLDPSAPFFAWGQKASWTPSSLPGGSPGASESVTGGLQTPGDSNQDGSLDIADAVSLLLRLFLNGSVPLPCDGTSLSDGGNLLLLDLNGDVRVDVSDAVHLLRYLFQNGAPPALGGACRRVEGCPSACAF
jgi:hypothetical protein